MNIPGYFHVEIWGNMSGLWSHLPAEFVEQAGPTETNRWRVTLRPEAENQLPIGILMRLTRDVLTNNGTMVELCAAWRKVTPYQWNSVYFQPLHGRQVWVRKA